MSKTPDSTGKPAGNADSKNRAGAKKGPSRRSFLKAGGEAQEIKDIEL
jgi:hypothetical protein